MRVRAAAPVPSRRRERDAPTATTRAGASRIRASERRPLATTLRRSGSTRSVDE